MMFKPVKQNSIGYGSAASRETELAQFIPYTRHIDESTIKTKDGCLLQIIKLEGIPFETADQIDLNQQKAIRATMLRGISSERFALYHHIIRRQINERQDGLFESSWCAALDHAYQDRLSQKRMFINEQYITLIRRPARGPVGLLAGQQEAEDVRALKEAVSGLISTLAPYRPEVLKIEDTTQGTLSQPLSFLSYLLNFEKTDIRLPHGDIASYLPRKRVSFGKERFEMRGPCPGDVKCGALLSVKEYADATGPGMLDALLRLPHEFILSQSFGFTGRQAALNAMQDTKRKLIAGDQGALSLEQSLDEAIDDLASGRSSFGEHHLSVTITASGDAALSRALSDINGAFVNLGILSVREDINLEPAFWAQLPGNFSYIARRALISNNNFAGFASLHAFPSGRRAGNHWGDALTRLETTSGTPYWFNFHERDVGNFTVIGPTGTGKTVLLTFLNAQAQRFDPKTIYFDKDRGAEIYLRVIGADYTAIKPGAPSGLNPLQLPDTKENRVFLREWVRLLVCAEGERPLSSYDTALIADAVHANFDVPEEHRRLARFAELLAGHERSHAESLCARLAKWHGAGERAWLFDNARDTLSLENRNIGFDLTAILDDRLSRTPWLFYIFHRIAQMLNGDKTIIMLDEGWKLLDDPVFALRIKDWMKTIRKQNGLIGFATQSAKDAIESSAGNAITEQSATQIFLPNARAGAKDYCEGFGLSRQELKIIRDLNPASHSFLIRHGSESVIARLDLSGMEAFIRILSGRTETVREMHGLIERYGPAPENWLPHFCEKAAL